MELSLAAWALSKVKVVVGSKDASALAAAITSAAASNAKLHVAGWQDWHRLLYGLSKAGGKCSKDHTCVLSSVFQRACQQLQAAGMEGIRGQNVANLLLAAGEAGADPQILRPLVSALCKELLRGELFSIELFSLRHVICRN